MNTQQIIQNNLSDVIAFESYSAKLGYSRELVRQAIQECAQTGYISKTNLVNTLKDIVNRSAKQENNRKFWQFGNQRKQGFNIMPNFTFDTNLYQLNGLWFAELIIHGSSNGMIIKKGGYTLQSTAKAQVTRMYNNRKSYIWMIED